MKALINLLRSAYELLICCAKCLQSPLLLFLRVYFFWQLFLTGKGKLEHIDRISEFFSSLHIPMPTLNAWLAGSTECFGGLLLVFGLCSRAAAIPVAITMIVAYITADFDAVRGIFSMPDKFVADAAFPYLVSALIVLAFGPGIFSLDALLKRFVWKKEDSLKE